MVLTTVVRFKLDLFDKRHELFQATGTFMSEVSPHPSADRWPTQLWATHVPTYVLGTRNAG
jgi:hypothetical protein